MRIVPFTSLYFLLGELVPLIATFCLLRFEASGESEPEDAEVNAQLQACRCRRPPGACAVLRRGRGRLSVENAADVPGSDSRAHLLFAICGRAGQVQPHRAERCVLRAFSCVCFRARAKVFVCKVSRPANSPHFDSPHFAHR